MLKFKNFLRAIYEQNSDEPNTEYLDSVLNKLKAYYVKYKGGGDISALNKVEDKTDKIVLGQNGNILISGTDNKGNKKSYRLNFIQSIRGQVQHNYSYNLYSIIDKNKNSTDLYTIMGYYIDDSDWNNYNHLVTTINKWASLETTPTKKRSNIFNDVVISTLVDPKYNKYEDWEKISLIINSMKSKYSYLLNMTYGNFIKFKKYIFNKKDESKRNVWLIQKLKTDDNKYYKITSDGEIKIGDFVNFQRNYKPRKKGYNDYDKISLTTNPIKVTEIKKIK